MAEQHLYQTDVVFEGTPVYLGQADDARAERFKEWITRGALTALFGIVNRWGFEPTSEATGRGGPA